MGERSDSLYTFICSICDQHFEQIPEGAIEISRSFNSRTTFWKFADGVTHALKKRKKQAAIAAKDKK